MSDTTVKLVKARKLRRCDARVGYPYPCRGWIEPGNLYARSVAFPNHDANSSGVPWVMAVCDNCAAAYPDQYPAFPKSPDYQSGEKL